jgi:HAD superfamily hydrolase (TIGR01549 family)
MVRDLPQAILFDLDGVLINSYRLWFHLLNHAARELGYPPIPDEVYRTTWGQSTTADHEAFFQRHEVEAIEAFYDAHYFEHLDHLEVPEEVPSLFDELRQRGLKGAVVTNTQSSLAREIVKRAGARPDVIVGGSDVTRGKPAPDMLFRAAKLLEVPIGSTWMVGDSRYDSEAARAAEVFFVGVGIRGDLRVGRVGEVLDLLPFSI